jgi:RNA polymerase sigma-70 factor (ECF subfamily)
MTERTLVQAAQAGLDEATDELIERYYARVYSFVAMQRTGDAEDLTQEVFARALGALPRFNGEYQFGAWLIQIARNVCIDEARRQSHRPQPTDPVDLVDLEPAHAQPDDVWESVSSQIAVTTVHRALARLPKRQRTVLVLREFEGMSYADIAIALRISTRAVEISLSRARKRMRLELKRLEAAEGELAACRRTSAVLAADPAAASRPEVADHLRQCLVCQTLAGRHRPRPGLHSAWGFLVAGSSGLASTLRRQAVAGTRLVQGLINSPSNGTFSPLSRIVEVGATVAAAAAVSASTLGTPVAPPQAIPVAAPIVVPVQAAPSVVSPLLAAPASSSSATSQAATSSAAAAQTASAATCSPASASPPAAASGTSGTNAANAELLGLGQLLTDLLQPVQSLSSSLCGNQALAPVGDTVSQLTRGLQAAAQPAPNANTVAQLLNGLLGLTAPAPQQH